MAGSDGVGGLSIPYLSNDTLTRIRNLHCGFVELRFDSLVFGVIMCALELNATFFEWQSNKANYEQKVMYTTVQTTHYNYTTSSKSIE